MAEAYVPHLIRCSLKDLDFDIISNDPSSIESLPNRHRYRKLVIGTISTKLHKTLDNSNWIYRFAVKPKYALDKVGEPLIRRVLQESYENNFYSVETNTSECQYEMRELMLRIGFGLRQIYHKRIIGNTVRIMCSQLGIDLNSWMASN